MHRTNGDSRKKRIAYVYHGKKLIPDPLDDIKKFNYGNDHPMKPKRVAMTHDLIDKYELYHDMKVYVRPLILTLAILLCY